MFGLSLSRDPLHLQPARSSASPRQQAAGQPTPLLASEVLYAFVHHEIQQLIIALEHPLNCSSIEWGAQCTVHNRLCQSQTKFGLPSLPPASLTRTPLSMNLARSRALSLRDMPSDGHCFD